MTDKAILFGINNYADISDLKGCLNDVENIKRLLIEQYRFSEAHIRTFKDSEVVREAILEGFKWLYDDAGEGDRLVFHFAGHGSHIPSRNNDEEVDELLCLYDMDWDDPGSYLIDDDLGQLTEALPANAKLTVILDCCHSGSGTRDLRLPGHRSVTSNKEPLYIVKDTARQIAEHATRTMRGGLGSKERIEQGLRQQEATMIEQVRNCPPEQQVQARFARPPERYPRAHNRYHKLGQQFRRKRLNHLLLAGAKDSQTAADTYIAGDEQINSGFHGAFTYYLCQAARTNGTEVSAQRIFAQAREAIRDNGYSQIPQIEGVGSGEPLFSSPRKSTSTSGHPPTKRPVEHDSPASTPTSPLASAADHSRDERDIALRLETLDLVKRALDLAERCLPPSPAERLRESDREIASSGEVVVYVHGISQHLPGYSVKWWDAMSQHLARPMQPAEVRWSDIVNPRSAPQPPLSRSLESDRHDLVEEIQAELEGRLAEQQRSAGHSMEHAEQESRGFAGRGSGFSVDDFARYMLDSSTRESILARFDNVVRPMLDAGVTLHIIAHSWGTVVAYEGLRRMDNDPLIGRVANLFVAGSALSIDPVRRNLFRRVDGGERPHKVERMINLDARWDVVGGPIGDHFEIDGEFLSLSPVGCSNNILGVKCAHSSYFNPANREVNHDIFAALINE